MSWYWIFYLIAMADNLSVAFLTLWIIAGILSVIAMLFWIFRGNEGGPDDETYSNSEEEAQMIGKRSTRLMKVFIPLFTIFLTLYLFMPNRNNLILIVAGGSVGQFLADDENAREIPHEIFELLRLELRQEIDEIKQINIKEEVQEMTTEEMKKELIRLKAKVLEDGEEKVE